MSGRDSPSSEDESAGDSSEESVPFPSRPRTLWQRWDDALEETGESTDTTADGSDGTDEGDGQNETDDTDATELDQMESIDGVEKVSQRSFFELAALPFLTDDPVTQVDSKPDAISVQFLYGPARTLLRNIPLVVAVLTVFVIVDAELSPDAVGLSSIVQQIPLAPIVYLLVLGFGLSGLLVASNIVDTEKLIRASFIYGLLAFLFAGSVYATYLTLSTSDENLITAHVTYPFPTLFFSLLLGMFCYDLLLKGETLFSRMGQKNIFYHLQESGSDGESPQTEKYNKATEEHITEKIAGNVAGIRYGHLFVAVILSQYLLIWSFKGPLGTGMISSLFLNVTINLIVLLGVYNFLIGILFLRKLIRGDIVVDGETIQPEYRPYHPDQRGGYADIGKCALQINFIIILIGAYYVFRAYISGLRSFPLTSAATDPLYADFIGLQITTELEIGFWLVNFLGAILLYAAIVVVWFYYTFWEMHKQMVKQKKTKILQYQLDFRQSNEGDESDQRTIEVPIGEVYDKDQWQELYDAPVWPINTRKISAVVTGNLLPIALSLPTVLPSLLSAWGI